MHDFFVIKPRSGLEKIQDLNTRLVPDEGIGATELANQLINKLYEIYDPKSKDNTKKRLKELIKKEFMTLEQLLWVFSKMRSNIDQTKLSGLFDGKKIEEFEIKYRVLLFSMLEILHSNSNPAVGDLIAKSVKTALRFNFSKENSTAEEKAEAVNAEKVVTAEYFRLAVTTPSHSTRAKILSRHLHHQLKDVIKTYPHEFLFYCPTLADRLELDEQQIIHLLAAAQDPISFKATIYFLLKSRHKKTLLDSKILEFGALLEDKAKLSEFVAQLEATSKLLKDKLLDPELLRAAAQLEDKTKLSGVVNSFTADELEYTTTQLQYKNITRQIQRLKAILNIAAFAYPNLSDPNKVDYGIHPRYLGAHPEAMRQLYHHRNGDALQSLLTHPQIKSNPLKFLQQQRWIDGKDLIKIIPWLCESKRVSKAELKKYLFGKRPEGKLIDELRKVVNERRQATKLAPQERRELDNCLKQPTVRKWLALDESNTAADDKVAAAIKMLKGSDRTQAFFQERDTLMRDQASFKWSADNSRSWKKVLAYVNEWHFIDLFPSFLFPSLQKMSQDRIRGRIELLKSLSPFYRVKLEYAELGPELTDSKNRKFADSEYTLLEMLLQDPEYFFKFLNSEANSNVLLSAVKSDMDKIVEKNSGNIKKIVASFLRIDFTKFNSQEAKNFTISFIDALKDKCTPENSELKTKLDEKINATFSTHPITPEELQRIKAELNSIDPSFIQKLDGIVDKIINPPAAEVVKAADQKKTVTEPVAETKTKEDVDPDVADSEVEEDEASPQKRQEIDDEIDSDYEEPSIPPNADKINNDFNIVTSLLDSKEFTEEEFFNEGNIEKYSPETVAKFAGDSRFSAHFYSLANETLLVKLLGTGNNLDLNAFINCCESKIDSLSNRFIQALHEYLSEQPLIKFYQYMNYPSNNPLPTQIQTILRSFLPEAETDKAFLLTNKETIIDLLKADPLVKLYLKAQKVVVLGLPNCKEKGEDSVQEDAVVTAVAVLPLPSSTNSALPAQTDHSEPAATPTSSPRPFA